jgi:glycosyltransferase involved in cell wall biosynthesis
MIRFPPRGYEFMVADTVEQRVLKSAGRAELTYRALWALDAIGPVVLLNSLARRWFPRPEGAALTYSHGHLVFRPEPWIVEVEYTGLLLGMNLRHLGRFKRILERSLASPNCRGIRCWSEAGRRSLVTTLDCRAFHEKIAVIPHAVPARPARKDRRHGGAKILFVGSGNIPGEFFGRGGLEVLEAFSLLTARYPEAELVIRSNPPKAVRERYRSLKRLRIIDRLLPWSELEQEFLGADIFLLPTHNPPPFLLMDAMSFELPIVGVRGWGVAEYVDDGRTGLLVEPSAAVPYYAPGTEHPNFGTAAFKRAIRRPDPAVVWDLVEAVSQLIEEPDYRRALGRAGRWEVEQGRLSIATRNERLKEFFDRALASTG